MPQNHSQLSSQRREVSSRKSNDIDERHLILKGQGFSLRIPDPNPVLHLDYRRTGVRISDLGIITHSGVLFFLFHICPPHNYPVNPRILPDHFAPMSPPIGASDMLAILKNPLRSRMVVISPALQLKYNKEAVLFRASEYSSISLCQ